MNVVPFSEMPILQAALAILAALLAVDLIQHALP
jgi:hypothetical protein